MKKFLVLFTAIILAFSLAACGSDETPGGNETISGTTAGETVEDPGNVPGNGLPEGIKPEDYAKFVKFDLPENFRQAAVDQMRKQAAVEWTPEYTFTYGNKFDNWGYEKTYEAGKKYTGLPYGAMNSSIEEFQKYLDEHRGRYAVKTDEGYYGVMGTQCNTAINLSLQQFYPAACEDSGGYWPAYEKFIGVKVGDYEVPANAKKGLDIMNANGDQKMYESYALANMGDVIMGKNDETGVTHVRMVSAEAVVVRNGTGQINGNRSYLVCVEQTDSWDSTRKDINTTWWMDHKYTFASLFQSGWIAVSLDCYKDNVSVIPYLALDEEITAEHLAKGNLIGTVSSDYPVNYVHLSIYDKAGKLVNRVVVFNTYKGNKEGLRKHSFNLFTDDIKVGTEYTFVLDAGIARGNAELARVDFTYTGK